MKRSVSNTVISKYQRPININEQMNRLNALYVHNEINWLGYPYFPGSSASKASACNARDLGSIPGSGRSPRKWQPTSVLLPGNFHGQRSLVGYCPWDCKESDMTEQLHFTSPIQSKLQKNVNSSEDYSFLLFFIFYLSYPPIFFLLFTNKFT